MFIYTHHREKATYIYTMCKHKYFILFQKKVIQQCFSAPKTKLKNDKYNSSTEDNEIQK